MKRKSTRDIMLLVVIAAACWAYGASLAKSAEFLEQNWPPETRQAFYSVSQGSQIMPYDWFRALERADSDAGFYADGLARHGYLPNPRSDFNPDGLPVGFAIDKDKRGWWIGLNCAACHTNQVSFEGRVLQIDGAPTQAVQVAVRFRKPGEDLPAAPPQRAIP